MAASRGEQGPDQHANPDSRKPRTWQEIYAQLGKTGAYDGLGLSLTPEEIETLTTEVD